jgi:hypothetical protein
MAEIYNHDNFIAMGRVRWTAVDFYLSWRRQKPGDVLIAHAA